MFLPGGRQEIAPVPLRKAEIDRVPKVIQGKV
jgi:hypothetical protein